MAEGNIYVIGGRILKCPHCGSPDFEKRQTGLSFLKNWLPKMTDVYTCVNCGNTQWFFNSPAPTEFSGAPEKSEVVEPPKKLEKAECQECGGEIPENELKCPACGEERTVEATEEPEEDATSEPADCLACGATIPEGQEYCPRCGWTYKS